MRHYYNKSNEAYAKIKAKDPNIKVIDKKINNTLDSITYHLNKAIEHLKDWNYESNR